MNKKEWNKKLRVYGYALFVMISAAMSGFIFAKVIASNDWFEMASGLAVVALGVFVYVMVIRAAIREARLWHDDDAHLAMAVAVRVLEEHVGYDKGADPRSPQAEATAASDMLAAIMESRYDAA